MQFLRAPLIIIMAFSFSWLVYCLPVSAAECSNAFQCYERAIVKMDAASKKFEKQTQNLIKENLKLVKEIQSLKSNITQLKTQVQRVSNESNEKISMVGKATISNKVKADNNAKVVDDLKKFKAKLKRNVNTPRSEITAHDGLWGSWTGKQFCPVGQYVCGLRSRFESNRGKGDDSALNSVRLSCCSF